MAQLIELKRDFMDNPAFTKVVMEPSSHFQKAKGKLPSEAFLCVCKAFFHIEHICLLRYNAELSNGEWIGLANGR